jgi:hypothetical protein
MEKIKEGLMANPATNEQSAERSRGVNFFAQNLNVQLFLAREGDPELLLGIIETEIEDAAGACRFLKTCIMHSRGKGIDKISKEASESTVVFENKERMRFYIAVENALSRLVLEQAA